MTWYFKRHTCLLLSVDVHISWDKSFAPQKNRNLSMSGRTEYIQVQIADYWIQRKSGRHTPTVRVLEKPINEGQPKLHLRDGLIFLWPVSLFRALLQNISYLVSDFYYTSRFHGSCMQIKSIHDHSMTIFFTGKLLVLLLGGLIETWKYHIVDSAWEFYGQTD